MSTMTIRVTSSAFNEAGQYGKQPDLGAPSYFDVIITDSTNPNLPNGIYDGYCLHPNLFITVSPTLYTGNAGDGVDINNYLNAAVTNTISQDQISQINWLLSQNFTSDAKYAGQYTYGEVQSAIWEILGYTNYNTGNETLSLTDNGRQLVEQSDIDFLVSQSQAAVASGINVLPSDTFFSMVVDPDGVKQPLIIQLNSAKLGDYVWLDEDADGIQDVNELGVDGVIVELYDANNNLVSSTITGDDYSTAEVETGYYQFTGLKAGDYSVKFLTPANMLLTVADANPDAPISQDDLDSDAYADVDGNGITATISLADGESNQSVDAGLVTTLGSLSGRYFCDTNNNDVDDGQAVDPGVDGVLVTLLDANGNLTSTTTLTTTVNGVAGVYQFTGLEAGTYGVQFDDQPDGQGSTVLADKQLVDPNDPDGNGDDTNDSDAIGNTTTSTISNIVVTPGNDTPDNDAGAEYTASLGDKV
ncbi:SdrD B-like domain-containing protein, partial [Neptunomonas sp.]|uniref:SdrD B-like domain-containing protein n=1 Tax=Neptunomonas sp. TaxID=1971898 RepID=UPI00356151AD